MPLTDPKCRVAYNDEGLLEEAVTDGDAHLERMSEKGWFLSMGRSMTRGRTGADLMTDVQCPKCGAKHFIMYGDRYICPCGHKGKTAQQREEP